MSLEPVDDSYVTSLNVSSGALFKRKTLKTCDQCRRRKVRCDGIEQQGGSCSNCVSFGIDCTSRIPANAKKRSSRAYIEDLEIRLANADKLIHLLWPGIDLQRVLEDFDPNEKNRPIKPAPPRTDPTLEVDSSSSEGEYNTHKDLAERENPHFRGKSSGFRLIRFAIHSREAVTGEGEATLKSHIKQRRQDFAPQSWMTPPRELRRISCNFPEPGLLSALVDLYFNYTNSFVPLLHRPTFDKAIAEDLHHREVPFAMNVLLVCAIAIRFSEDPRIPCSFDKSNTPGWIWFYQAQEMRGPVVSKPSLYEMQAYCLSAIFLEGASPDHGRWTMIGTAVRLAQEVGIHRKRRYGSKPSVQNELWKRVFWVLLLLDRTGSAMLGRSCALQEEDFDLDLLIECDDEYWESENPRDAFKQPAGKPSYVSFFNWSIKLSNLMAMAHRKSCSINKFKSSSDKEWDERTAQMTETAMEDWINSLPDHLRWDPQRKDLVHYKQSVLLRAQYYVLQLSIRRPFIRPGRNSQLSEKSLLMSTKAARDCCNLVYTARERLGLTMRMCSKAAFIAAVLLLLNVWQSKAEDDTKEVEHCIEILGNIEQRWHAAGRMKDILSGLLAGSASKMHDYATLYHYPPIPQHSATNTPGAESYSPASYKAVHILKARTKVVDGKPPPLSAAYWMGVDPSSLAPPPLPPLESSSTEGYGDFEMWSTPFVGDAGIDEWSAYLDNVSEMVREMQSQVQP